jgi:signal transduction histidine kinase
MKNDPVTAEKIAPEEAFVSLSKDTGLIDDRDDQKRRGFFFGKTLQWYHIYFVLASVDLVVIGASAFQYHGLLESYRGILSQLNEMEAERSWVTSLQMGVVEANAPGNDVFESRDPASEIRRFEEAQESIGALFKHPAYSQRYKLADCLKHWRLMVLAENNILDFFVRLQRGTVQSEQKGLEMAEATSQMALMDRHQAAMLRELSKLQSTVQVRYADLLEKHAVKLSERVERERYLLVVLLLILVAIFAYGKKLQKLHQQLLRQEKLVYQERMNRFSAVLTGQENVRQTVARELHDGVGASLATFLIGLKLLGNIKDPVKSKESLTSLRNLVQGTIDDLRRLARGLHPMSQLASGFAPAIELLCEEFNANPDYEVDLVVSGIEESDRFSSDVKISLYRILQEALHNIDKHAHAQNVSVIIEENDGTLNLIVEDDGVGIEMDPDHDSARNPGMGLRTIQERVELMDAYLDIESVPGGGTAFFVRVQETSKQNAS